MYDECYFSSDINARMYVKKDLVFTVINNPVGLGTNFIASQHASYLARWTRFHVIFLLPSDLFNFQPDVCLRFASFS